jgi:glycerophosphoryl diester phosphodiesterase
LRHHWDAEVLPLTASLACQALICHHSLWTAERVQEAQQRGLRTLSYTVNEEAVARQLLAWGLDGIITDRVDLFKPDAV